MVLLRQFGPSLLQRQSDENDRRIIFLYDKRVINDEKKVPPTFQLPITSAMSDLLTSKLCPSVPEGAFRDIPVREWVLFLLPVSASCVL